jgi:putative oxidoreductase
MSAEDIGIFLIRAVTGLFFAGHGAQLLLGWFGGGGLPRTRRSFEGMGFRPVLPFAVLASGTQLVCGLGVALGVLWPVPAALLIGPMVVAIVRVHWPKIWVTQSGIEYPMVMGLAMAGIGLLPPGELSLDHALGIDLPRHETYWVALAAAALGAFTALGTAWRTRRSAAATAPAGQSAT